MDNDVRICPFDRKHCSFPDGEHFKSADFVGCKITDYDYGGDGSEVFWVCPRFPLNLSITAVRDAFMRARDKAECSEAKRSD